VCPLQLIAQLRLRLSRYRTTIEQDEAIIVDPSTGPRQTVAARLLKIEKGILQGCLAAVMALPGAQEAAAFGPMATAILMD
jgi:histone-lysine N-methyltransferase SETD3